MTRDFITRAGALFAEFDDPASARRALDELLRRGYKNVETFSPFPFTREQADKPGTWPALAIPVFAVAAVGGVAGYLVQWYANAAWYPLNIGGRPAHAVPAFLIPAVETLLLFGGVAAFVGLLIALRLPRLWRPIYEIEDFERASIDRFWIAIRLGDGGANIGRTDSELRSMNPIRVLHVVEEE